MLKIATIENLRTAAVLTGAYVYTTSKVSESFDVITLDIVFVIGSLTSAEIVIEFSQDDATWFQQAFVADPSGGFRAISVSPMQMTASGSYSISFTPYHKYCRIGIKGTGTVTDSSASIDATFVAS